MPANSRHAISPGTIDTPGLNELLASGEAGEQRRKMVASAIPVWPGYSNRLN
jgi:hypothetical protein